MVYDTHQLVYVLLRLGEPDKAIYHLKQSSNESAGADVARAQSVKSRIAKSSDARRLKNWITVLQEAQAAVSDGADCAPQVSARPPRHVPTQLHEPCAARAASILTNVFLAVNNSAR
jgi:hypothetical protein